MERKKFFSVAGLGIAGFLFARYIPFKKFLGRSDKKKINVRINSMAVKRQKIGEKNV